MAAVVVEVRSTTYHNRWGAWLRMNGSVVPFRHLLVGPGRAAGWRSYLLGAAVRHGERRRPIEAGAEFGYILSLFT